MLTDTGKPYSIEKALSAHGGGYGRGFIVTHRPTQTGAFTTSLEDAFRWIDADASYRRARDERVRNLDAYRTRMAIGADALARMTEARELEAMGL